MTDAGTTVGSRLRRVAPLLAILAIGTALRLAAITGPGHPSDLPALSKWAEDVAKSGISGYYASGGTANYPPVLYALWPLGTAFDDGQLRTAIRVLSIPFDIGIGVVLYWIGRTAGTERQGLWGASLYLLNPAIIVSGPLWGQLDALGALPMLGSLFAAGKGRVGLAAVLAVLAGLMKTQFGIAALVLGVILGATMRERDGIRRLVVAAVAAAMACAAIMVPLGLGPLQYLSIIRKFVAEFPYGSLNAFNPWALFLAFPRHDVQWFYVGAILLAVGVVLALSLLRIRHDLVALLAVGFLIALALYFLPTRVHERYLFGAIVLLTPLAGLYPSLRVPYAMLSAVFAVTLLSVLMRAGAIGPSLFPRVLGPATVAALVVAAMASAAWCAWRLRPLFRVPIPTAAELPA